MEPPANFFPSKDELIKLVLVLAIASAVAVSCNFFVSFVNHQSKPFCDSNLDSIYFAADSCEPCPSHGECRKGELECHKGYRKKGKLCIEDGDINLTAKQLAEWVESHLCTGYAQLMCYGSGAAWAVEEDLLNDLDGQLLMRNSGKDSDVYTYAKQRAVETIAKSLETRTNSAGKKEFKCPDALAENYKPFSCRIRHWIIEHALLFMPVCALCLGFAILMWRIHKKRCLTIRAEELYNEVCEILEENALVSNRGHGESEPWVVASRLRDHLLLPKERKNPVIWRKVEELVQEDSRVDRYPKLVKGESRVVWEWQVEGSLSSTRIRKKTETGNLKTVNQIMNSRSHDQHYESKPATTVLRVKTEAIAYLAKVFPSFLTQNPATEKVAAWSETFGRSTCLIKGAMTWKRFLEWLLRVLNLVLTVTGLSVLGYGIYLLEVYKHAPDDKLVKLGTTLDKLPKAWFLYLLTGIGAVLSVVSCCGCLASLTRNKYCLSCYAILVSLVVLVELLCAAYIYFDGTWEDKVPTDNTGNFDTIYEFLEDHWETLQWVALALLILEVFLFFLALAVRAVNRPPAHYDSDEEYNIVPKQQNRSALAAALDQHLLSRNDAWTARMREKYGLDTAEFTYNPSDSARNHEAAEERSGCTIM